MPILPSSVKYLSPDEVSSVIENTLSTRDKALLATVYQCGLRRSEAMLLGRDDFMPRRGHGAILRVTRLKKAGAYQHEVVLWRRTASLIQEYLDSRKDSMDALFLGRMRNGLCGQMVYYIYRAAAGKAGIKDDYLHPHCLRHSIAVHLRNMGVSLDEIKEHLGHDSIESTLVYAKVVTPTKARTALLSEISHHCAKF